MKLSLIIYHHCVRVLRLISLSKVTMISTEYNPVMFLLHMMSGFVFLFNGGETNSTNGTNVHCLDLEVTIIALDYMYYDTRHQC